MGKILSFDPTTKKNKNHTNLQYDDANSRLGLGTASPATTLTNTNTLLGEPSANASTDALTWRTNSVGYAMAIENTLDSANAGGLLIEVTRSNTGDIPGTNALYIKTGSDNPLVFTKGVLALNRVSTPSNDVLLQIEMTASVSRRALNIYGSVLHNAKLLDCDVTQSNNSNATSFNPYKFRYQRTVSSGSITDNFDTALIERNSNRSAGTFNALGSVLHVQNILTGTVSDTTSVFKASQDAGSSGNIAEFYHGGTQYVTINNSGLNVITNVNFAREDNHTISVAASTTLNAAGGDLSISSGDGTGTGNGGILALNGGTGAAQGIINIGTSNAGSVNIGKSGITTTITGALTQTTGAISLTGNAASSINTTSGNLVLTTTGSDSISIEGGADVQLYANGTRQLKVEDGITSVLNGARFLHDGRHLQKQATDVASAGTLTLGDGNSFVITGTTNIDYITTTNWQDGAIVTLIFNAALTVNHNTGAVPANTAAIKLAGAANFTTAAGDTLTLLLHTRGGTQTWMQISKTIA